MNQLAWKRFWKLTFCRRRNADASLETIWMWVWSGSGNREDVLKTAFLPTADTHPRHLKGFWTRRTGLNLIHHYHQDLRGEEKRREEKRREEKRREEKRRCIFSFTCVISVLCNEGLVSLGGFFSCPVSFRSNFSILLCVIWSLWWLRYPATLARNL